MEANIAHKSFFSFFDSDKMARNRREVLHLAETLKKSDSQEIKIIDYSVKPKAKKKAHL